MLDPAYTEKLQQFRTPFYFYDMELLKETVESCKAEAGKFGYDLHYALKANSNPKILSLLSRNGFGADCVSGNEVSMALANGFPAKRTVFSGVGKTDEELRLAIGERILSINAESVQELEVIQEIATAMNERASVSVRIIPGVDAHTHRHITTGLEENKFGILPWQFDEVIEKLKTLDRIDFAGLHFHIGSQITDLDVFKSLCKRVNEVNEWFCRQGFVSRMINVGGGLGVDYEHPERSGLPDFAAYFKVFHELLEPQGPQEIHFEPGRAIVAQCGSLITRVLFVKEAVHTKFAIVDAGMNDLIRPALYQSYHKIENLTADGPMTKYDVVGPICESSDCFGKAVCLPPTKRGDLIAIRSTGAYGQTMASRYNLRDIAGEIYSDEI